jgi:hypothetical protein
MMLRWASNIFCALSLLLVLILLIYGVLYANATHGVWLKRTDVVQFAGTEVSTPHIYYLNINGTELILGHWRNPRVIEDSKRMHNQIRKALQQMRAYRADLQKRMPNADKTRVTETPSDLERVSREQRETNVYAWSEPDGFHLGYHDGLYSTPFPEVLSFGGIKYDSLPNWTPPATAFRYFVPIWYILPLLLAAPAWRGAFIWRRFRRHRAHLCQNCGYDLRATPDVCPECGNATG